MVETMNKKEENLKNAFNYIHTFYNEVAQMLSDTIEALDDKGWEAKKEAKKDNITDELSYSLDSPEKWMCYYVYKNFINKKIDTHYKGIMIIFDEYRSKFPPSVLIGNINVPPKSYFRFYLYWLWSENKDKLKSSIGKEINVKYDEGKDRISGKLFVIPLTEIESRNDLETKIVNKLLNM